MWSGGGEGPVQKRQQPPTRGLEGGIFAEGAFQRRAGLSPETDYTSPGEACGADPGVWRSRLGFPVRVLRPRQSGCMGAPPSASGYRRAWPRGVSHLSHATVPSPSPARRDHTA